MGHPSPHVPQPASRSALDPDVVYYVESVGPEEDPTALLARHADIREGWVGWDDTNRDRLHRVERVRAEGSAIIVECERGFAYRFTPLTLEVYQAKVQKKVELSPSFGTTRELVDFYRHAAF